MSSASMSREMLLVLNPSELYTPWPRIRDTVQASDAHDCTGHWGGEGIEPSWALDSSLVIFLTRILSMSLPISGSTSRITQFLKALALGFRDLRIGCRRRIWK